MSQEDISESVNQATSEVAQPTEAAQSEAQVEAPSVRISKKTGKEVRPLNDYQKFVQENLKKKDEDGKRLYSMGQLSDIWHQKKHGVPKPPKE